MDERSYFGISGKSPGVTQSPNAFKASNFPYKHKRTYKQPQQSPKLAVMSRNERMAQYFPNRITHQNRPGQKSITHPATSQPQSTMPTIAIQTREPTSPTNQQSSGQASNFWQTGGGECFFQIMPVFGEVRFFLDSHRRPWPPERVVPSA